MRKNVAAVITAMGALLSIITDLVKYIREFVGEGVSLEIIGDFIYRLAKKEGQETLKAIAQLIAEAGQCAKNTFVLEVDHSLTREQLVKALGCDWVDLDFTENNVPLPKSDKKENITVELLHFNENISDKEATRRAKERGYRRATPREVMTLGVKHKDLQRDFPIIAAPTGRRVLYLDGYDAERYLDVSYTGFDWRGTCRFAVVREQLTP